MLSQWTAYCQTIAVRCVEIVHLAHSHLLESLIHWYTVWWAKSWTSCKSSNKWKPCHSSFTSINWWKNLWIESLCCSWFMLVQFSIAVYIYIYIWYVCFIDWFPAQNPIFTAKTTSPWTTPAGESIAECFWAIASWHPGEVDDVYRNLPET